MPGGAGRRGDSASDDDGGGAVGEHVGGVLGGRGEDERDGREEQGGDGVGVGDGAGGGSGAGGDDGDGTGGGDGVRGDGVGVGDVSSVYGIVWTQRQSEVGFFGTASFVFYFRGHVL